MDQREKKRSRSDKAAVDDGIGGGRKKKEKPVAEGDDGVMAVPSTTEDDEVDEFFAILRRMHVAVKYFERGNGGDGARRRLTSVATPSLEREAAPAVEGDVKVCVKTGNGVVLDLNTVPEGETCSL